MVTRTAGPADRAAIRRVHEQAFAPSGFEADLVDALWDSPAWLPELSLVALLGGDSAGELVGHALFSRVSVRPASTALALGPIGVLPAEQRRGIGGRLIRAGLTVAAGTDYPLVVVLGHPEYYPRFGFEPAGELGITAPFEVPPEAWMVRLLPADDGTARGEVRYPPEWGV